jgi:hypothetical protein
MMTEFTPVRLTGTTAADGSLTVLSEASYNAKLYSVVWIDGDLADGVDAVLSVTNTDVGIDATLLTLTDANSDATYYPRYLQHGEAGAALTGTAGGDRTQAPVVGKLKLVVASGGDAKTGGAVVYLCE